METNKNTLIVLGAAGVLLLILIIFGIMGAQSNPGSVANTRANYNLDEIPAVTAADQTRGASNAAVKLIEYSDIECPFCQDYHEELLTLTQDEVLPNFSWSYRHFPLIQIHPDARRYAIATECAADGGEFWSYLDTMVNRLRNKESFDKSGLVNLATSVGLNSDTFAACLDTDEPGDRVDEELQQAMSAGATGTPFSVFEFNRPLSESEAETIRNMFGPNAALVFNSNNQRIAIGGSIGATQIRQIVSMVVEPQPEPVVEDISEGTSE